MYIADLHIHSKYSRATSRDCTPEWLEFWARRKGISLIGTGDFTHPAWREELKVKLLPDGSGLYTLRGERRLSGAGAPETECPRFVLSGEISSIYKKNGRTRKVHNVILLPSLEAAETLSQKLEAIGNIHSDGRPILGLDSRELLEITLDACPEAIFIPAHIWTPHFSLFGAFSGFDAIEECFEDLTPHIHALETGLSSDPPMNWRLSALDGYTLVSNSDAHSPSKLGREANLLETELSYEGLYTALQTGEGFLGTIEFFPEEGKYHYDGHRACKLCLSPAEAAEIGDRCPICGRKLTIGVQHRVEQLADRAEGFSLSGAKPFQSLAPLPEVIAASTGAAAGTRVQSQYEVMLRELGPEFYILREAPVEEIARFAGPCVAEGIRRLREGRVERSPGYDGEYGTIQLLERSEMDLLNGQTSLFGGAPVPKKRAAIPRIAAPAPECPREPRAAEMLNGEQRAAVTASDKTVAVIAGPGTGKTRTLTARAAWLVEQCGAKPSDITAVTFTNRAAGELRERLESRLGKRAARAMTIGTFHSICLQLLQECRDAIHLADEYDALEKAAETVKALGLKLPARAFLQAVSLRKNGAETADMPEDAYANYNGRLKAAGALDFDDLLLETLSEWEQGASKKACRRFSHLLVDEFQDCTPLQYRLIRAWNGGRGSLFVIGDPDQAIYGFRGSVSHCFHWLAADFPQTLEIHLRKNYRSTPEILRCALPLIRQNGGGERFLEAVSPSGVPVRLVTAESDLSEGIFIAKEINRMVGGVDMLDADSYMAGAADTPPRSFSDIAVLYRTRRQAELLEMCLGKEGIPYIVAGRDDFLADKAVRGTVCFFRFLLFPADALPLGVCLRLIWDCPEDLCQSVPAFFTANPLSTETLEIADGEYRAVPHLREWLRLARLFLPRVHKGKPRRLLEEWRREAGLPETEALRKLFNTAVFHESLSAFLNALILGGEGDLRRGSREKAYTSGAVTLSTLHASKGLEFPAVFLCGLKKGLFPLENAGHPADLEEERRLFYVGVTRPREELILLASQEPSPFLSEIPHGELQKARVDGKRRVAEGIQLRLF